MQKIQLYIEGKRVDMFSDESVTITDTLKNAKDIDKVFTEFSKTFSLPASKINNKIFKHYYNFDIINGFDARVRIKSNIELNTLAYKDGFIKLEGVDLKNNVAHTYKITFFGNTVSLKNLIGDDQISALNWLNNFNTKLDNSAIVYNSADIKTYLTTSNNKTVDGVSYVRPIQVPLLTHTQRLFYNSASNHPHDDINSGNLFYQFGSTHKHGVKFNELKYAVKLDLIIQAIQKPIIQGGYGITFSNDFFNNSTNTAFNDLYLWLHRTKGKATNGGQITSSTLPVTGWSDDNSNTFNSMNDNVLNVVNSSNQLVILDFFPIGSDSYNYTVFRDNVAISTSGSVSGNSRDVMPSTNDISNSYRVEITSSSTISFSSVKWSITNPIIPVSYNNTSFIKTNDFELIITQQLPKMKVLDFIKSIFKMFNLVSFIKDGIVVVKTLDSFYSSGVSYDITKYLDVKKSQSNVALPFREINFTYKGLGTFLAKQHDQLFNQEWGKIEYNQDASLRFSGGIYDYSIPFEHMKFERLIDVNAPTVLTNILWGFCVDDNQESYIGDPIIFYMKLLTDEISFVSSVDINNDATFHVAIQTFFSPCNSNMNVLPVNNQDSINFDAEPDEFTGITNLNTLFQNYHTQYITSIFNQSNRITKLTAYLPLRILLNYTLADRFQISGNSYKINSISNNLKSGESKLELLNDL